MKKFIKITALVIGVLLLLLLAAPFLFKNQIINKLKQAANEQLNATIDFDNNLSLSFFRSFPNVSLGIHDLSIVGKAPFEGDTLALVKKTYVVVDFKSLFSDEYQVRNIALTQPYVQLLVDSSGHTNWDIAKSSEEESAGADTAETAFNVGLQKYSISDGHLIYSDFPSKVFIELKELDHQGKGDFTQDIFKLSTTSHARELTFKYAGVPYLNKLKTDIDADIDINLPDSKYAFSDGKIQLNGLDLGVEGNVAMPNDDVDLDLTFNAEKADFKNFLSLIPAIYQNNFDQLKATGELEFDGFIKGIYSDDQFPSFGVNLSIDKGMFQYPSVPEPLSDVNLNMTLDNPGGSFDQTFINAKQLHFVLGKNPFDARVTVATPQSDPQIDAIVKGKLDLSDVSKIYPLEKGTTLSGLLDMDVQAKGRLSAIEKKQYKQFNASGKVVANQLDYQSSSLEQKILVHQGQLDFSPQVVKVSNVKANIGRSDIQANGGLDNLFGYLFGKDNLKGNLNIQSDLLDLNEMMGTERTPDLSSSEPDSTSDVKAVVIPRNIDFNLKAQIGQFLYSNYDLSRINGTVRISNGILTINNLSANMLDGSALLSGTYDSRNPKNPKTDFKFKASNFDIQKTAETFNTVKALAPVARFVQGSFSGDIDMNTLLSENLFPQLTSINGLGNIDIPNLNIKGFEPLKELADKLGISLLKNMDLKKLLLHFKIDSGFLLVNPFEINKDGIKMDIQGKNGLNKVIDYTINMDIPREKLGGVNNELNNLISNLNKTTKGNLDLGDQVKVGVQIGGTITQPQIKVNLTDQKQLIENALKNEAKQQLSKGADKALNKLLGGDKKKDDSTQTPLKDSTSASDSTNQTKPTEESQKDPKDKAKDAIKKGLKGLFDKK